MSVITSLSLCARITLDLHSLNNEGTEGNQQQTRMVHIIDQKGKRAAVNAVTGDMFKHILVGHLIPLLEESKQPLSPGARLYDADRINAENPQFVEYCEKKADKKWAHSESEILNKILTECSLTDIAGALVTGGRSVARKSVAEFGWVVGLPEDSEGRPLTTTEQYFHVKYAPEGRGAAAGGETVAGKQAIFHRPASSGVYAFICSLDVYRIGLNDITRKYVVSQADRSIRARCLVNALVATLVKPAGAQRNTQNPHIVACEGVVAGSTGTLPAPTVSPLNDEYRGQITGVARVLNSIQAGTITTVSFDSLAEGLECLANFGLGPRELAHA